jgi:hypothetical protein
MKLTLSALLLLAVLPAGAAVNFRTQVWPILAKSCVDCHRAPHKDSAGKMVEPKGRLRLDGAGSIMKGGADGDAVVFQFTDIFRVFAEQLANPAVKFSYFIFRVCIAK